MYNVILRRLRESFLPWKSNKYDTFVGVCARVRACALARAGLNIKFHQNPSSGSRVVPCRLTDGQTDMTKLIVTFRNYENAPKNQVFHNSHL